MSTILPVLFAVAMAAPAGAVPLEAAAVQAGTVGAAGPAAAARPATFKLDAKRAAFPVPRPDAPRGAAPQVIEVPLPSGLGLLGTALAALALTRWGGRAAAIARSAPRD